jgi:hypothetical protein
MPSESRVLGDLSFLGSVAIDRSKYYEGKDPNSRSEGR